MADKTQRLGEAVREAIEEVLGTSLPEEQHYEIVVNALDAELEGAKMRLQELVGERQAEELEALGD